MDGTDVDAGVLLAESPEEDSYTRPGAADHNNGIL